MAFVPYNLLWKAEKQYLLFFCAKSYLENLFFNFLSQ